MRKAESDMPRRPRSPAEPRRHQDGEGDERGAKGNLAALVLAHAVGDAEKERADQDGIGDDEKGGEC